MFNKFVISIFIFIMNYGQSLIFPNLTNWALFSGPWYVVVLMTLIGLVVGLFHRYTSARQMDVFEALDNWDDGSKASKSFMCWYLFYH